MKILVSPKDSALTQSIIAQVNTRLADLTPGEEYTLDRILGGDFWDTCKSKHKAMGAQFAQIVRDGRTPFQPAELNKKRHNQYYFRG